MILNLLKRLNINGKEKPQPQGAASSNLLQVTADASRCVQCGICGFNCPVGIEVREFARRGENVTDTRCLSCGTCVEKCPRGTLKWGPAVLVRADNSLEVDPHSLPIMLQLQSRELS